MSDKQEPVNPKILAEFIMLQRETIEAYKKTDKAQAVIEEILIRMKIIESKLVELVNSKSELAST